MLCDGRFAAVASARIDWAALPTGSVGEANRALKKARALRPKATDLRSRRGIVSRPSTNSPVYSYRSLGARFITSSSRTWDAATRSSWKGTGPFRPAAVSIFWIAAITAGNLTPTVKILTLVGTTDTAKASAVASRAMIVWPSANVMTASGQRDWNHWAVSTST